MDRLLATAVLVVILVVGCRGALANEFYFKYGLSPKKEASSKVFGLGAQGDLGRHLIVQSETSILSIPSNSRPVTMEGSVGLGLKVDMEHFFGAAVWGPGFITTRDDYLGGYFQFNQDITFGMQDQFNTIGVGYKHISSAGLESPNRGRDYLYFRLGVKF